MARPNHRRRTRQHRASVRQLDRDELERTGWRTTLELRENHVRSADGRLLDVETVWVAAAERRVDDDVEVVTADGPSESRVWAKLLEVARASARAERVWRPPRPLRAGLRPAG